MSYCVAVDLEDEGLDITDTDRINDSIALAEDYIDLMTGQWFDLRVKTYTYDGGLKVYFLPIFCKELTEVKVDSKVIEDTEYTLYNRYNPDDRNNPKVKFDSKVSRGDLFLELVGNFGFVEEDESTPTQIKHICTKLAIGYVGKMSESNPDYRDDIERGRILKEVTDGHSYDLGKLIDSAQLTGDPEIDTILQNYMAPLTLGAI